MRSSEEADWFPDQQQLFDLLSQQQTQQTEQILTETPQLKLEDFFSAAQQGLHYHNPPAQQFQTNANNTDVAQHHFVVVENNKFLSNVDNMIFPTPTTLSLSSI